MTPHKTSLSRQSGTSLLVAMVALVAMMTAGMALMRSVDSANLAASNYQMQQSAEQNIDMAMNEALLAYMQSLPGGAGNMMNRNVSDPGVSYFATVVPVGAEGIPNALLALPNPAWDGSGPVATGWPGESIDPVSKQLRRYFVERMCQPGWAGMATSAGCEMYTVQYDSKATKNSGEADRDELPYIRITVRVDGPKGATSYAQMFMKGE